MTERTFVMLKPDALHRGKVGEIIGQLEETGLQIAAIDIRSPSKELAREHYGPEIAERHGEDVRENLVEYISEFTVIPMVLQGRNAVSKVRDTMGESFDPMECSPGSIRGDLSSYSTDAATEEAIAIPNLIHGAESAEAAENEIDLWFPESEFAAYERPDFDYINDILG
ncbi:nucleoside-diphosphate kinase [Halobacteriaceae archaeon SHR40]|uniref:nucleoside-diphosphate kinase n=1 Tax=Halovenus amylolytica TaxID=2500550 RepID=UPI000FE36F41